MMHDGVLGRWRSRLLVGGLTVGVCGAFAVACGDEDDSGPSDAAVDECVETMSQVSGVTSVQALYNSGAISQRDIKHAVRLAGGVAEAAYEPVFGEKGNASPDEPIRAWEAVRHRAGVAYLVGGLLEHIAPESYENYEDLYEKTCRDILDDAE